MFRPASSCESVPPKRAYCESAYWFKWPTTSGSMLPNFECEGDLIRSSRISRAISSETVSRSATDLSEIWSPAWNVKIEVSKAFVPTALVAARARSFENQCIAQSTQGVSGKPGYSARRDCRSIQTRTLNPELTGRQSFEIDEQLKRKQ